jgi:HK97 family phage prohead protease
MNFSFPLRIVAKKFASDGEPGEFSGMASTWDLDSQGDAFVKGAWAQSIAALNAGTQKVPLLAQHDPRRQVGIVTSAAETDAGLAIEGKILPTVSDDASRIYQLAKAGGMSLSVGFNPQDWNPNPQGRYLFTRAELVEVSAVSLPANRQSRILEVRALPFASPADLEKALREGVELGPMPRRAAERVTKALLRAFDLDADDEPTDPVKEAALESALALAKQSFITRK